MFFEVLSHTSARILDCFRGFFMVGQVLAIVLTIFLVLSGFDWWYFEQTRDPLLLQVLFPVAFIGFIVPIFAPLILVGLGYAIVRPQLKRLGVALVSAEIVASFIAASYKALTGRAHPALFDAGPSIDISREFHFGFLEGGIFWGWPSSHTAVAFAMAGVVATLYPQHKALVYTVFLYALYIGIGVSATIHWFSDFTAGAIVGTIAGVVVGRSFLNAKRGHQVSSTFAK